MMQLASKKKICLLMPYHWSHSQGGAEYQSKCIVEALSETGRYEIYFLARYVNKDFVPTNHKIVQVGNLFGISKGRFFLDAFEINRELSKINPDIIYQRVGSAYTGIGARFAKKCGCKFVWHIARDDDVTPSGIEVSRWIIEKYIEKRLLEYGLKNATHIIAQTQDQATLLFRNYHRKSSSVIYNFHPPAKEPLEKKKPIKIVWIANLKPAKRPDVFLDLARDLNDMEDVEFIMIGALQGRRAWKKKILARINENRKLTYMGSLSQEQVNAVLASSHVFVNTSKLEGFPNTFIQAWMRGVPVVSLSINPDGVFDRNQVGYCSMTYERMKDHVLLLINDNQHRETMGFVARKYSEENHSYRNTARLMSIFDA